MIGQKEEASNLLEELLYQSSPSNISRKKYDRGLFVSINNHKQGNDDLYASIKKQYQSLMYALTGKNISRDAIRVTDKLPQQKVILDCLAEKNVFAAAAFLFAPLASVAAAVVTTQYAICPTIKVVQ